MEIKINLDIEAAIQKAISPEALAPLLQKAMADAVKCAVEDATGYRSKFREAMKEQLAAALPHGLKERDVVKFQQLLNASITDLVDGVNNDTIQTAMKKVAHQVLPEVPSRVKLSELIKAARESFHIEESESFYAHLKISDYGGGWLYLDSDDATRDKYEADTCLAFTDKGDVYSVKLQGNQLMPVSTPAVVGEFDTLMVGMYVGRVTLEIDIDADEVESMAAGNERD